MLPPDQRLFEADLQSAPYRIGVTKGRWAQAEAEALPDGAAWPKVFFWMATAPRASAPDRFYVGLDVSGYPGVAPTGAFWDPVKKTPLEFAKWPKGKPSSRFAMIFRTTGFNGCGRAFYHPYDRVATQGHAEWPQQQPHLIWSNSHTIVDYLEEFQSLFTSGDYVGV